MINKRIIQKNFSSKSQNYNANAVIQKNAAKKLCDFAEKYLSANAKILDLGSGTSFIAKNLAKNYPNSQIFETDISFSMLRNCDKKPQNIHSFLSNIEELPIKNKPLFDAVFASFSLQWVDDFEKLVTKLNKITNPNATVAICLPIKKTLEEISISSNKSGCNFYFREFYEAEFIENSFKNAGFVPEIHEIEIVKKEYLNSVDCLKNIKIIGANYFDKKNLVNKSKLKDFNDFFSKNYNNNASWHILFLIYKKI